MKQRERVPLKTSECKGFRLHKLEVFNWGTFDGQVYSVQPEGSSALLIGQNGSGKSTLVDALLTLLVRPGVRNFNVAAGAKKRERDERTYVRGAYDRGSDDDGLGVQIKYLRPKGDQYSVILATFRNADSGKAFTVAQLLYLTTDLSVDKVYCLSEDERSIQADFGGLASTEGIQKILRQRGFRVTKTFQEFEGWFNKLTKVKPKAMEIFNQTVAVKDIQKLNDFIRDHMLESHNWDERVDSLLAHFTDLNAAHDSLVRVRQQFELLDPIGRVGAEYQEQSRELQQAERLLEASDAYFWEKVIELFTPAVAGHQAELEEVGQRRDELGQEIHNTLEKLRQLKNEMEQAGGDRLRQIPILIEMERQSAANKRDTHERYVTALKRLEIGDAPSKEEAFLSIQKRLPAIRQQLESKLAQSTADRDQHYLEHVEIVRSLQEMQRELASLNQRKDNIPEWCVALRESLCQELGMTARELPFAAELLQVAPEERVWEASIEKVLHGFALSLLVPERFYHSVSKYVDKTRLTAQGRGQRLVYLRVGQQTAATDGTAPVKHSLIRKLKYRDGHELLPWVKAEVLQRFNYQCCETIEEFQNCRGLAMTRNRHVKSANYRHDKDDRDQVADPRNFVLGWDNREKKQRLATEIQQLEQRASLAEKSLREVDLRLNDVREQLLAVAEAARVVTYSELNFTAHEREITVLERERRDIESKSDRIKSLKQRYSEAESHERALTAQRDQCTSREGELKTYIQQGSKLLSNARGELERRKALGTLTQSAEAFAELDALLSKPPLSTDNLFERKESFRDKQESQIRVLRKSLEPVHNRLVEAMSRFLRVCPEEANDLRPTVDYLDSFMGLRQRIAADDLPRHERRFKERLNQKVIEEIGLFRGDLDRQRREIEDKIELLNLSLRRLEYRPGTHIQLEPRPIRDAEINEFRDKLRECVDGAFDDSSESNEARFVRIKELVLKLRDDASHRWREKVIDVRKWFDFTATVIDRQTQKTVSVYQDSSGQSGGEKAKLAFTILVAAIAYQYDLDPEHPVSDRFHFVVVDEMFSKVDDQHAEYALELFKQFGLQLLIVAPLDAKARVTQPYVGSYIHITKTQNRSAIYEMTAQQFEEQIVAEEATPPRVGVPR